jgi:4-deoxy-L-threo-5-hexosulose-uronate ketol-isomerase
MATVGVAPVGGPLQVRGAPEEETLDVRHATNPAESSRYSTEERRAAYLVTDLFPPDTVRAVYSHADRVVVAGTGPVPGEPVLLPAFDPLRSAYFLERRELGVVNIGGPGLVQVDGAEYALENKDCLYVGRGAREVVFASAQPAEAAADSAYPPAAVADSAYPAPAARFYLVSTAAHTAYPTKLVPHADAAGVTLGSAETSNDRTLYKYVHADGVRSCQLVLGVTVLQKGSMWNTMPCHTHDRRTEVYMYFDLDPDHRIVHLMGRPDETRNIIVANEQAVISPSWSVHCGVGTSNYAFVWAMAGENQAFDDMDLVAIPAMR